MRRTTPHNLPADVARDLTALVRETTGAEPAPHELPDAVRRVVATASAATTKARRAEDAARKAAASFGGRNYSKARAEVLRHLGMHEHGPIERPIGTEEQALAGEPVRLPDGPVHLQSRAESMTTRSYWATPDTTAADIRVLQGVVGTPSAGGIPQIEQTQSVSPFYGRGLSWNPGEFESFYRRCSVVRSGIDGNVAIFSGARAEVVIPDALTESAAAMLGIDRAATERIAESVNVALKLGGVDLQAVIEEGARVMMKNGASVQEFALDPFARDITRRITAVESRLPNTWMRWIQAIDPDTGRWVPVGLQQCNPASQPGRGAPFVDLRRCIHMALSADGDNFEGISMLRAARQWDLLAAELVAGKILHFQRFSSGFPVIRRSSNADGAVASSNAAFQAISQMANLNDAVIELGPDVMVDFIQMKHELGLPEIIDLCTRHKRDAVSDLIGALGSESAGAYNLGDIKTQMAMRRLHLPARIIERGINTLVRRYVDTFYGPQLVYPVLRLSGFASRSPREVIEVQKAFGEIVASGTYTDAELVEIAAAADLVYNGRGTEGDLDDEQATETDPAATSPAEPATPAEPETRSEEPEGHTPPPAAAKAAAAGRRARNRAADKWPGTIAELALSKAITEQRPLSRLQLREIEAYFDAAAPQAPYTEGSPEWQEWQCMGGDAMAQWVLSELGDDVPEPAGEPEPETRAAAKYDHIDFAPPQGVRDAARRALEVREAKPPSERGMEPTGIARARDLANGRTVSPETARRMLAFFERHESSAKGGETWDEQGKGWQAWHGWGGDAGFAWARKLVRQMDAADESTTRAADHQTGCGCDTCMTTRAARDARNMVYVTTRGGGRFQTWRSLTSAEQSVAFDRIQANKADAQDAIIAALGRTQRQHRAAYRSAYADALAARDVVAIGASAVNYTDEYAAAILPHLQRLRQWASDDMLEEIADSIGTDRWSTVPQTGRGPTADELIRANVAVLARNINDRANERFREAALQVAAGGPAALLTRVDPGVGYSAAGLIMQASSTAVNEARAETALREGPEIEVAVYTAVMDRNTCDACAEADGTEAKVGSEEYRRLTPPNPRCNSASRGENRCQCAWVYEYAAPEATTRALLTDEPRTPTLVLHVGPPGAGKSTTTRDLLGVVDRDDWTITPDGYDPAGRAPSLDAAAAALREHGVCHYVACLLSHESRAATARDVAERFGAPIDVRIVAYHTPRATAHAVNQAREGTPKHIAPAQLDHMLDAWSPPTSDELLTAEPIGVPLSAQSAPTPTEAP